MGRSTDYSDVSEWVVKPEGYDPIRDQREIRVKYQGNIFKAKYWAGKEPGIDPGWGFEDELYDLTPHTPTQQAKIIAYLPAWKKDSFDYAKDEIYRYITHGIIAFLMFDEKNLGKFTSQSSSDVNAIIKDVVNTGHRNGAKVMVALGGATDYGFLNLMTAVGNNPETPLLDQAVQEVVGFVRSNNLDGVDLDLECWWDANGNPRNDQGGRTAPHPAGHGLTAFAKKLRAAMPDKLISAAFFASSWYGNNYQLIDYVDWIGVMTYDLTGSWNNSPVGPHSALDKIRDQKVYEAEQQGSWPLPNPESKSSDPIRDNPIQSVEEALWYWTNPVYANWQGAGQRMPRNKFVGGVPLYGYDFAYPKDLDTQSNQVPPGYKTITYKDILTQFPDASTVANGNIKVSGSTPRPPFVSASGSYPYTHNIYFETPDTAVAKLNFLKSVGAQGVIIWELTNDVWEEGKSIIKALYQASGNPEKVVKALEITVPTDGNSPHWGEPRRDSCVGIGLRPKETQYEGIGLRQYTSRLWGLTSEHSDWEAVAWKTPASIHGQSLLPKNIERFVNEVWGKFEVEDESCTPHWGDFKKDNCTGDGLRQYSAILWDIKDMSWESACDQMPAKSPDGEYFEKPTRCVKTQSLVGIAFNMWGEIDVVDSSCNNSPTEWIEAQGQNLFVYYELDSVTTQGKQINAGRIVKVPEGAPYLCATLVENENLVDFPKGAMLKIQGPDGTVYNRESNDENLLARMSGSSLHSLIVSDPLPGDWLITLKVPESVKYLFTFQTIPLQEILDTITTSLSTHHERLQKRSFGIDDVLIALVFVAVGSLWKQNELVNNTLLPKKVVSRVIGGKLELSEIVGGSVQEIARKITDKTTKNEQATKKVAFFSGSENWPLQTLIKNRVQGRSLDRIRFFAQQANPDAQTFFNFLQTSFNADPNQHPIDLLIIATHGAPASFLLVEGTEPSGAQSDVAFSEEPGHPGTLILPETFGNQIRPYISQDCKISILACEVASGDNGRRFIETIARAAGSNVEVVASTTCVRPTNANGQTFNIEITNITHDQNGNEVIGQVGQAFASTGGGDAQEATSGRRRFPWDRAL